MDGPDLEPLLRYWRAQDELFDRVDPAWWGAVVSDPRYPRVHEPNYARVETRQRLGLAEIDDALLPAMSRIGNPTAHAVVFHPEDQTDLVVEASTRGDAIGWDLVMEHPGAAGERDRLVEEVTSPDDEFWAAHRASLRWFDVADPDVLDQVQAIERDLLLAAGRRWFAAREEGSYVALAAVLVLERVGYVDHVVTFPQVRRRGLASALVRRAVSEASTAGAERTYLLADPEGAAVPMYERIGFRPVTKIASWLSAVDEAGSSGGAQPRGAGR